MLRDQMLAARRAASSLLLLTLSGKHALTVVGSPTSPRAAVTVVTAEHGKRTIVNMAADDGLLRFNVGDEVQCYLPGPRRWAKGKVVARRIRRKGLAGVAPYQVKLDEGSLILLPSDDERDIRTPQRFDVGDALQNFLGPGLLPRRSEQRGEEAASTQPQERCCANEIGALPGTCCDTDPTKRWVVRVASREGR